MTTLNAEAPTNDTPTGDVKPDAAVTATNSTEVNENFDSATEVTPEPNDGKGKQTSNTEAAKYRTQLRTAETALEAANGKIAEYQRADILRAAHALAQPSDLLDIGGHDIASLLNEDGTIDTDAVTAKVAELLELRPGLAKGARVPVGPRYPNFGQGAPATSGIGRGVSWAKALNPHRA